jgi:molecular chaperone DnaK
MTITGGSSLPKDDIERMRRDAEEHAEDDRKRREDAETRNVAEARQWQTEKFLAENGDKLPAEVKSEINDALSDLRAALGGTDIDKIKTTHARLDEVSQKAGAALYEQASPAGPGAGPGAGTNEGSGPKDETVVDAEIIDDEGKKQ